MRPIKTGGASLAFQLDAREKRLLCDLLGMYPLIPVAHHQLSKSGERPEDQELLEQAVAAQRKELKKQVDALLKSKTAFRKQDRDFLLSLKPGQLDWLLQVLNDVRVGSWIALGSPENLHQAAETITEKTARHFLTMELAGHFQMAFLSVMKD